MGTGLKIYTLPPTAGPGTASDSFKPWGQRPALAAILGTLTACCGQREGTGLGNSCALGTGPGSELHPLPSTAGPGTTSGGSISWGSRPALAACCDQREGTGLGSSRALDIGTGTGPEIHPLPPTASPGTASGSSKPRGAPSSLGGHPGHPDGLLRPVGGHRPGKQLRPGHLAQPEDPHAAPCGGP